MRNSRHYLLLGIIPARAGFTCARTWRRWGCWDHPRSRGVYTVVAPVAGVTCGSSPLARGLLALLEAAVRPDRIIPARAGFTYLKTSVKVFLEDHPRSRGVYGEN